MRSAHSGTIYQVQLTNESLYAKLLDSKVNDYVTLGYFENEKVTGRLVYRSKDYIHVALSKFYVMVDLATKIAFFVDLGGAGDRFSSAPKSDDWIYNQSGDKLGDWVDKLA